MTHALIVKFGGSSIASPDLMRWVQALERSLLPMVIVPGGGPFARTVRQFQARIGYDDDAAYRMAILAMEQFGHALISLGSRLVPAATPEEIAAAHAASRIPVWMPERMAPGMPAAEPVPAVTSDGLAAWLAAQMPGSALCLIKQIDLPEGSSLDAVMAARVVDAAFEEMLHPLTRVFVAGPKDLAFAGRRLGEGGVLGVEVLRSEVFVEAAQ
jgi:5-(aminomethyl)-3-furanmethanol phosphate kinase